MKNFIPFLVLSLFIISLGQAFFLIKTTSDISSSSIDLQARAAQATATATICVSMSGSGNLTINTSKCLANLNQSTSIEDNSYSCQLELNPNRTSPTLNWYYVPIIDDGINFSINNTGYVNIYANQFGIGAYNVTINVSENVTNCDGTFTNGTGSYWFRIWDINDPPYLTANIPSRIISAGSTVSMLYLNNYFDDYEDDDEDLSYSVSGNSEIVVVIVPSTSEVKVVVPASFCDKENIYFTAKDTGNLTGDSNMITLDANCIETTSDTSSGSSGSSSCTPEWECRGWSQCFMNGTRFRQCIDMNGCDPDNLRRTFWEDCEYIPTCFDGVRNGDEQGIDCGGSCPACYVVPTCFDGIKNGDETGVDCGGSCDECSIIETCFDGIQNQNETGVDCGGPCDPCKEIQVPAVIEEPDSWLVRAAIISGIILVAIAMIYLIFKKEINSLFAKFSWWLTRKQRKQYLLTDKEKKLLLSNVVKIEKQISLDSNKMIFETKEVIVQTLLRQIRLYFSKALDINVEFLVKELVKKTERMVVHENLRIVFNKIMRKTYFLEKKNLKLSRTHLMLVLEQLRLLVIDTSRMSKEDFSFKSREYPIEGDRISKILRFVHNATIALQYSEVEKAKKRYLKALNIYEELPDKKKEIIYEDIEALFNFIKCAISWKK